MRIKPHENFQGVYWVYGLEGTRKLATQNLTPGRGVYGEKLVRVGGLEFRLWDPYRSKLAAALWKGLKTFPFQPSSRVLYLGAATGTTASHVSDIIGSEGKIYCVEFAQRVIRELVSNVCAYRKNMIPLMADARKPETYRWSVEKVDAIYCDIAQPEQARVLVDNAEMFLKPGGRTMLAVKARSIDVTKEPSEVFRKEVQVLEGWGMTVLEKISLEPYDKDHSFIVAKPKA